MGTPLFLENQRDKRISRNDEFSDSEDEGDERRNEKSYRDNKRPRLIHDENNKNGNSRSVSTGRSQLLSSPQPPEPSPITPLPQEETTSSETKGIW